MRDLVKRRGHAHVAATRSPLLIRRFMVRDSRVSTARDMVWIRVCGSS